MLQRIPIRHSFPSINQLLKERERPQRELVAPVLGKPAWLVNGFTSRAERGLLAWEAAGQIALKKSLLPELVSSGYFCLLTADASATCLTRDKGLNSNQNNTTAQVRKEKYR